jgi:hypothetical protein
VELPPPPPPPSPMYVDSENILLKIGYRPSLYQLFSKRDFFCIKLAKIDCKI